MAEEKSSENRRRHIRRAEKMKVSYWTTDVLDRYEDSREEIYTERNARSADISLTGMQIICDEPLPPGKMLKFDIHLPNEPVPLTTFGMVEWCFSDTEYVGVYKAGVNFTLIDPDHTQLLKKLTGEE